MKYFRNLSLIATFAFALTLSACSGITDANHEDDQLRFQAEDMQDQQVKEQGEEMEMVRIRPE
ncbi:hypothetical protein [Natronogracilivirga saccharolytica]|uniref:Secreted protein n=1 Tax=Natronogracilivirga saccharolytica TaxID=2812953 RepID=A0A8J7RKY6_9BACT|nr:hypothetical protein [Natronogracilivirga saccharolytica]MBP3193207.1 hypothetical protein [Natronogracilivirga saccharolytica]